MTQSLSDSFFFGDINLNEAGQQFVVALYKSNGTAYTGSAAQVQIDVWIPTGGAGTFSTHTNGTDPGSIVHIGNGMWRFTLPLAKSLWPGRCGLNWRPLITQFEDVGGHYQVRGGIRADFSMVYAPVLGSPGLQGVIQLYKWHAKERTIMQTPLDPVLGDGPALTTLNCKIYDNAAPSPTQILNLSLGGGQYRASTGFLPNAIFFEENVAALSGGYPVTVQLNGVYSNLSFDNFFMFGSP